MDRQKQQLNVYIPPAINDYIDDTVEATSIQSKSDFIHMLVSYSRQHFSKEDLEQIYFDMMTLGEIGIRKVE